MFRRLTTTQFVVDVALAAGFLLVFGLTGFAMLGATSFGDALGYRSELSYFFVALVFSGALAVRRWSPGLSLGLAWLGALLQMGAGLPPGPVNLAIFGVLYVTAAYGNRLVRWLGFASIFVGALAIVLYLGWTSGFVPTTGNTILGFLASAARFGIVYGGVSAVGFTLSWTAGLLARTAVSGRQSRLDAAIAAQEVAAEQERTRIARDMHDVVAHSLAVIVAQADGARYLGTRDPAATGEALTTIASTARDALGDVRLLLAQLRYSQADGPQPTLGDLDRLLEQLEAAGLTLVRENAGEPLPLSTAQQLAVYRIVQESLTNALRHADTSQPVVLIFAWTPHGLDLTILSSLPDERPKIPYGPGHGIAGMTERAALVGGRLTARVDGDRFVVRAWLPSQPVTSPVPTLGAAS